MPELVTTEAQSGIDEAYFVWMLIVPVCTLTKRGKITNDHLLLGKHSHQRL